MKHTYHISGMTCKGCQNHVEKVLSSIAGVSNASVNLENEEATIEMDNHIPIEKFRQALVRDDGGSYEISTTEENADLTSSKFWDGNTVRSLSKENS